MKAVGGGIADSGIKMALTWGMKRGVFSNEAGLGSSVMVHSRSNVKEPVRQGIWGIFQVFADTIVVGTMTALVVLTSGLINLDTGILALSQLVARITKNYVDGKIRGERKAPCFLLFDIEREAEKDLEASD